MVLRIRLYVLQKGMNYLMKRTGFRKKVNAAVFGLVIAICICIVIYKIF